MLFSLPKTFFPHHSENKMKHEGNVSNARKYYFKNKPNNLHFLLFKRFNWMNKFITESDTCVELGSGPAFSKEFIKSKAFKTSDITKQPWIDLKIDALDLPFKNSSLDVVICSHMIHHLANPSGFIDQIQNILTPGGRIILSEINTSYFMKLILKIMKHEGWSYEVDVFNQNGIANKPEDPWSANCAIPELLFINEKKFHRNFPNLKIIHNKPTEFLIFPLSGGVISKSTTIPMPYSILRAIDLLDELLIKISPNLFALGREIVIEKNKN